METCNEKSFIHITSIHIPSLSASTTEWLEMAVRTAERLQEITIKSGTITADDREALKRIAKLAEAKGISFSFDEADLSATAEQRMAPLRAGRKWNSAAIKHTNTGTPPAQEKQRPWYQRFDKRLQKAGGAQPK